MKKFYLISLFLLLLGGSYGCIPAMQSDSPSASPILNILPLAIQTPIPPVPTPVQSVIPSTIPSITPGPTSTPTAAPSPTVTTTMTPIPVLKQLKELLVSKSSLSLTQGYDDNVYIFPKYGDGKSAPEFLTKLTLKSANEGIVKVKYTGNGIISIQAVSAGSTTVTIGFEGFPLTKKIDVDVRNPETPQLPAPPGVTTGVSSNTVAYNSFNLTWDVMERATSYKIYKDGILYSDVTGTSASITGLTASTIYSIEVSAVNSGGASAKSVALSVTTLPPAFAGKWGAISGNVLPAAPADPADNGKFNSPNAIAINKTTGDIYVADSNNHRIQKFNSSMTFADKWGSSGVADGKFNGPYGIAIDATGYIYVTDAGNNRIQKFKPDLTFDSKWGSISGGTPPADPADDGKFKSPNGIAINATTGDIYVTDTLNNRIQKFNSNGTFSAKWGSQGAGEGQFKNPMGIAIDATGNVYVVDYNNYRIQKFDSSGAFLGWWGKGTVTTGKHLLSAETGLSGSGDGQFNQPRGITIDTAGNIYVADSNNYRIQKFDSNMNFITKWGSFSGAPPPADPDADGKFHTPCGIVIDSTGNIYVTEVGNHRIQKFKIK